MNTATATTEKKTLKQVHAEIRDLHKGYRQQVLNALGLSSLDMFYNIITGTRKLSPAEKQEIARIYGKPVEAIDWQDGTYLPE